MDELTKYKTKLKSINELAMVIVNSTDADDVSLTLHFKAINYTGYKNELDVIEQDDEVEFKEDFLEFLVSNLSKMHENNASKEQALEDNTYNFIEKMSQTEALEFLEAYAQVLKRKIQRLETSV